ncbi:MAG: anthranilate phosphoribosyltransferase [Fimbriimonadaceae bacterium]|jgi:anthranilate phosphoribosyltransferase|nr:anthranilate phosphoribosyltransferase [Fimbriimonadaceae bacterium]
MMEPLLQGQNLDSEQAKALMCYMTSGEATDAQIGAACTAMRVKTATAIELAAFASVLRDNATTLPHPYDNLVDTCGTGGGAPTFNISTASSFIAAAAGVRIAKHGNRGVTSRVGSADVLEALGAKIQPTWEVSLRMLGSVGLAFFFAPAHHPGMRHVGQARRDLGFRTVFNQLGPLANPAGALRQLVGVYDHALAFPMAEALMLLGTQRALIAHGEDGLDEISPCAPTRFALLWDGELTEGIFTPHGFGIEPVDRAVIQPGSSSEENAERLRDAITNVDSMRCTATLPSAACAIWIAGLAPERKSATELAREVVASGAARQRLDQYIEESQAQ